MDDFLWWRDGIIYQIYPRSFADSNDDGLGDLHQTPEQTILVTLNFKNRPVSVENVPTGEWKTLFSTNREVGSTGHLQLAPYEVLILESA